MTDPVAVERLLVRLAPRGSGVAASLADAVSIHDLPDSERALVDAAVPARIREFAAGRSCAHRALAAIGADTPTIGRGTRRQPLWPAGVTGSISHAGDVAAAVALPVSAAVQGLGLDIERADALDDDLWPEVLSAEERAACAVADDAQAMAVAVFGAKEAAFKALYPLRAVEIGFLEALARIDDDGAVSAIEVPHLATSVAVRQGRVGPLLVAVAVVAGGEVPGDP